jgi:hypothetical protein
VTEFYKCHIAYFKGRLVLRVDNTFERATLIPIDITLQDLEAGTRQATSMFSRVSLTLLRKWTVVVTQGLD